ncbi:MAG: carboxypeptidase-like regulatory domain-containing protein [Prolixibacteraceae bacterium]
MYKHFKFLLLLTIICFYISGFSQVIRGTVIDKSSAEAIPFASIYFSGTTLGTTSNDKGDFELSLPKDLSNPLTVSAIGFNSFNLTNYKNLDRLTVSLEPKKYELPAIEISGDENKNIRKRFLPIFRKAFLGMKVNAKQCRILNEGDIMLQYDKIEKTLKAFARHPILIQNDQLGYNISYFLDFFEVRTTKQSALISKHSLFYAGHALFIPIKAKDIKQKEEFEKERDQAYFGSKVHFFKSLWDNNANESGFKILDSNKKILTIDKLVHELQPPEGRTPQKFLVKQDPLVVYFDGFRRKSMIYIQKDFVFFNSNGNFDTFSLVFGGYWGKEGIADLLPFDYVPD